MSDATPDDPAALAWGWAGSALQVESGDLHVVVTFPGGALVGLIDGLGHGSHAAEAARAAAAVLEAHASDPLEMLVQHCHDALRKTRGAVMSLASFRTAESSMTWLGIGNVDAVLVASSGTRTEAIAGRGGVVGYQLPVLRSSTVRVSSEDTLIMVTDGIRGGFTADLAIASSPQEIADTILARFTKGSDDAHVVAARYHGGRS
jgi:negative regulator of sigma-B (phosphoserine phosphatase)